VILNDPGAIPLPEGRGRAAPERIFMERGSWLRGKTHGRAMASQRRRSGARNETGEAGYLAGR